MKNKLSVIFFLIAILPTSAFCEENLTWEAIINPKIGEYKFTYNKEENNIIVYSMLNNAVLQNIPAPDFTDNGSLEFMDLDDDGYKDIIIYSPIYISSGPIPSGEVWTFNPKDSRFIQNEEFTGEGYIEKAKQHGCVMITNRAPDKYNYLTNYWCFNTKSKKWVFEKTLNNHKPKGL
jgi:hypothetical protein